MPLKVDEVKYMRNICDKDQISILVVEHKPSYIPKNEYLKPIQVGTELAGRKLPDVAYYDNEGKDNISSKNRSYSELTAIYWAWKNLDASYYGLFHYRRYLSFSNSNQTASGQTVRVYKNVRRAIKRERLNEDSIRYMVRNYDVIVPKKEKATYSGYPNAYEHYKAEHNIRDLEYCLRYISKKHPDIYPYAQSLKSDESYAYNMFIMRADIFKSYCTFLFDVLEHFDHNNDISSYDSYQGRVDGFLAERLTSIYIHYLQATTRYNMIELTPIYFENATRLQWLAILPDRVMRYVIKHLNI